MSRSLRIATWIMPLLGLGMIAVSAGIWAWFSAGWSLKAAVTVMGVIVTVTGLRMRRSITIAAEFTTAHPDTVREWRRILSADMDAYYVAQFTETGIALEEVARTGTTNLENYRKALRFEAAAGIRFGEGPFTHPSWRILQKLRYADSTKDPAMLRVIAFLACGPQKGQPRALPQAEEALGVFLASSSPLPVATAASRRKPTLRPDQAAGWLLAYHAVVATGMAPKQPDALRVMAPWRILPHRCPWLFALAGIAPEEAQAALTGNAVDEASLMMLSRLRGYPATLVHPAQPV